MELKIALLTIHFTLLIFILTRPVIIKPKEVFGASIIDRDENTSTVVDYDTFGENSERFKKFYMNSFFIKFVFFSFVGSMLLFIITMFSDIVSVDSPKAITKWPVNTAAFHLSIQDTKSGNTVAEGPVNATFVVGSDGQVYPVKTLDKRVVFLMLGKGGPTIIDTKSAGEFFGVIALFLAIACVVLWIGNKTTTDDEN